MIPLWWERYMKMWTILEKALIFLEATNWAIVLPWPQLCSAFLEWRFGSSSPFIRHRWDFTDGAGSGRELCQVMMNFGPKTLWYCNDCKSCFGLRSSKKVWPTSQDSVARKQKASQIRGCWEIQRISEGDWDVWLCSYTPSNRPEQSLLFETNFSLFVCCCGPQAQKHHSAVCWHSLFIPEVRLRGAGKWGLIQVQGSLFLRAPSLFPFFFLFWNLTLSGSPLRFIMSFHFEL